MGENNFVVYSMGWWGSRIKGLNSRIKGEHKVVGRKHWETQGGIDWLRLHWLIRTRMVKQLLLRVYYQIVIWSIVTKYYTWSEPWLIDKSLAAIIKWDQKLSKEISWEYSMTLCPEKWKWLIKQIEINFPPGAKYFSKLMVRLGLNFKKNVENFRLWNVARFFFKTVPRSYGAMRMLTESKQTTFEHFV